MTNFFSAIQNKFKAGFHGRYLGHIVEQVAEFHPKVTLPLLVAAQKSNNLQSDFSRASRASLIKSIESVTSEIVFLEVGKRGGSVGATEGESDRRADLEICLNINECSTRILVEIKMFDRFLDGQLDDYINWAKGHEHNGGERRVVFLTAYPLSCEEMGRIKKSENVCHMYLSGLVDGRDVDSDSELIKLFKQYLYEEGYAMYRLDQEEMDYKAFLSFMTLSFLPHASGRGKVSSAKNISRGPIVFSNLVQNWQLISDRLSSSLNFSRRPTIRYFPEQGGRNNDLADLKDAKRLLQVRSDVRQKKDGGRYWLTADNIISDTNNVRIEWGQVIQINKSTTDSEEIQCVLYALVREKAKELSCSSILLEKGIFDPVLYSPEKLIDRISSLIGESAKAYPDASNMFKNITF